jgi:tetratricopeptide (TPR) repeat protein
LLAGEPGIGKSRLLREAAARATQAGWQVLAGGCQRQGGQEPYAPILDALHAHLQRQTPAQRQATLQGCAWLVRLLPELADAIAPPAWSAPPEQERRLMFEAVARCLANAAGPAGTLLVLDDLQWAGVDALDLLRRLVRSPDAPVRIVGSYRDTEVQPQAPLDVLLADLAHGDLASHYHLGPLADHEALQLLEALLVDQGHEERSRLEQVVERVGAVPFFLVSCARGLRMEQPTGQEVAPLPWNVAQSIRQRVANLPGEAQAILGVAAVIGRVVPLPELVAAAGQPEQAVLAGLDASCHAQLLEELDTAAYRFVHDVIREVVEADLGVARRTVLHRRVAEALEAQPGERSSEMLAFHYARGGAVEKAAIYLEQAGDQAQARHAHAAAEEYYRDAMQRRDNLRQPLESTGIREKLAEVLGRNARTADALAMLGAAAASYRRAGDLESLARVAAHIGDLHAQEGTVEQGIQMLQPLVEVLEASGPSASLAAIHLALSDLFYRSGRYTEMLQASERAAAIARLLGEERLLAAADAARGSVLQILGRLDEGLAAFQEAVRLMDACGDLAASGVQPDLVEPARRHDPLGLAYPDAQTPLARSRPWLTRYEPAVVLSITGVALATKGMLQESARVAEQAVTLAAQRADPRYSAWTMGIRGMIRLIIGDWEGARADVEQSVALYRQFGLASLFACGLIARGWLNTWGGAWDVATRDLEECLAIFKPSGDLQALRFSHGPLAEIDIGSGRPATARGRLVPLLDRPGLEEADVTHHLLPRLAWAMVELGEVTQALDLALRTVRRARAVGSPLILVEALWTEALVASRQGHRREAERALDEGLALAQSLPYPYVEGRLLHLYGALHVQHHEPEPSRARLEAAQAIFQRLGALKDLEQTEALLVGHQSSPERR